MSSKTTQTETTSIATSVAPEDLKCGDFVGVLSEMVEFPSFFWCDSLPGQRDELVRIRYLPAYGGVPLKVKAICLPFVHAKSPSGAFQTIDLRKTQLVRLTKHYAKTVWEDLRHQQRQGYGKRDGSRRH